MKKTSENIANNNELCYYSNWKGDSFVLIEYRVKNFMSFKDQIVLSMVADKNRELEETHVFKTDNYKLLKTAAIFGANASGKTNFIESISFFNSLFSKQTEADRLLENIPNFKLDDCSNKKPVSYEITFLLEGKRYRYGIEVNKGGICSEWLYFVPNRQEACYYKRENNEITFVGKYFEYKKALEYIKPDLQRPFLYTLAQDSIKEFEWAKSILEYLKFYIRSSNLPESFFTEMIQLELHKEKKFIGKEEVIDILKAADIGISDITITTKKNSNDELLKEFVEYMKQKGKEIDTEDDFEQKLNTLMHHKKFNEKGEPAGVEKFPLVWESKGTQKFYSMLYPILYVLKLGGVLFIDEIESSLHHLLCVKIIELFNNKKTNPKNAQLIFTTHNTLLMAPCILRRDQIYFFEKNRYGASKMYSLYDIDLDIRKDFNYTNNYLSGRFGAIPYLDSFNISNEIKRANQ